MSESDQVRPSCGCIKTKCVQRYCSCFRARRFCSENCRCAGCRNTERYEALTEERVELILKKNPNAFDPKVAVAVAQSPAVEEAKQVFVQSYTAAPGDDKKLSDAKGCSCHVIKCSHMSCECFKGVSGSIIKQEICVNKIKSEQYDTGGITNEALEVEINVEEGTQSEQTSSSYPNKRPRIFWHQSEQDDNGGITNEAINTENPTQSEDT